MGSRGVAVLRRGLGVRAVLRHRGIGMATGLAVGLCVAGCAGAEPVPVGPPASTGHGSVEEVLAALAQRGLPCRGVEPVELPAGTEQAVTCRLAPDEERVLLVHFFDRGGAAAFEAQRRDAGAHGVYADEWAAATESSGASARIAAALQHRASS